MESTTNFDEVIDHILDGPSEVGPATGDYFYLNGNRYYDDSIPSWVADTICGMHGPKGCKYHFLRLNNSLSIIFLGSYWPTYKSWSKRRWGSCAIHGNLMWNHRDEEWYRKRSNTCTNTAEECAQPKPPSSWNKFGTNKHLFDVPYEQYCTNFLESALS